MKRKERREWMMRAMMSQTGARSMNGDGNVCNIALHVMICRLRSHRAYFFFFQNWFCWFVFLPSPVVPNGGRNLGDGICFCLKRWKGRE